MFHGYSTHCPDMYFIQLEYKYFSYLSRHGDFIISPCSRVLCRVLDVFVFLGSPGSTVRVLLCVLCLLPDPLHLCAAALQRPCGHDAALRGCQPVPGRPLDSGLCPLQASIGFGRSLAAEQYSSTLFDPKYIFFLLLKFIYYRNVSILTIQSYMALLMWFKKMLFIKIKLFNLLISTHFFLFFLYDQQVLF